MYELDQLAQLLHGAVASKKPATFAQLADGIADWGKRPGVDPATTTFLDPLQNILLLGHGTSRYGVVPGDRSGAKPTTLGVLDRILGTRVAYAAEPAGCADLRKSWTRATGPAR